MVEILSVKTNQNTLDEIKYIILFDSLLRYTADAVEGTPF